MSHWSVSYVDGSFIEPTLTGSLAGECVTNAPWIVYDVVLNDPDGVVATDLVSLVFTDGTNTETIELGTLVDGKLSGKALWPGATVAEDGVTPTGWPGWAFVDGEWVVTDENFAWTRDLTEVTLVVNPELTVDLAYPAVTLDCAPPSTGSGTGNASTTATSTAATGLAATGFDGGPIGIVAALLAVAGLALLAVTWVRRRRA
ncbi:cell wall protein [Agromyces albus]|uniref:Cell wall protein n=1 Tax=Agromyces albus TaxID=205332 RepID=A0A4Q2KYC3_9MICO|nr:cell wall protein [Agromyces albus]